MEGQAWNDRWVDMDKDRESTDMATEPTDVNMEPTDAATELSSTESSSEEGREYNREEEPILFVEVMQSMLETVKQLSDEYLNFGPHVSNYADTWSDLRIRKFPEVSDLPGYTIYIRFSWDDDENPIESGEIFNDGEIMQGMVDAIMEAWKDSDELDDVSDNFGNWILERSGLETSDMPMFNFRAVVTFDD